MDDDLKNKLKRMLENGEINGEIYKDMIRRWGKSDEESSSSRDPGEEKTTSHESDSVIRISGSGELPEARAHELRISGSGRVNGPVEVDVLSASGSARISGNVKAKEKVEISGSLRTSGNVESGSIEISGSLRTSNISCSHFENSGSAKVEGDIEADNIDTSGSLQVDNVRCDELDSSGSVKAKNIEGRKIEISGSVNADFIKAEEFTLENWGGNTRIGKVESKKFRAGTKNGFLFGKSRAEIGEIEAERIEIEDVKCGKIKADEAVIGDNCEIDYLEARVMKLSDRAKIREKKITEEE